MPASAPRCPGARRTDVRAPGTSAHAVAPGGTLDYDGRTLCISVVNRHRDQALTTRIELQGRVFDGPVEIHEVNAADVSATNSFEQPDLVGVRSRQLESAGSHVEHTFPAHSLTIIRARLSP